MVYFSCHCTSFKVRDFNYTMMKKWDAELYDKTHDFVSKYGEGILSYLNPKPDETILDLGCGTGDLTQEIFLTGANIIGVDGSSEMIAIAKSKYPHIGFYQMDAREMNFEIHFDAVFSNAVLHWIPDKERVIEHIHALLKDKGRMVVEFGGKGNMQNLIAALKEEFKKRGYQKNALIDFWYFPSIAEYATELEKYNFRVIHAEHFDRTTPLKGDQGIKDWFNMFGDNFFTGIENAVKEEILDTVQDKLKTTRFIDGIWTADYKRIRIVAIKND